MTSTAADINYVLSRLDGVHHHRGQQNSSQFRHNFVQSSDIALPHHHISIPFNRVSGCELFASCGPCVLITIHSFSVLLGCLRSSTGILSLNFIKLFYFDRKEEYFCNDLDLVSSICLRNLHPVYLIRYDPNYYTNTLASSFNTNPRGNWRTTMQPCSLKL